MANCFGNYPKIHSVPEGGPFQNSHAYYLEDGWVREDSQVGMVGRNRQNNGELKKKKPTVSLTNKRLTMNFSSSKVMEFYPFSLQNKCIFYVQL